MDSWSSSLLLVAAAEIRETKTNMLTINMHFMTFSFGVHKFIARVQLLKVCARIHHVEGSNEGDDHRDAVRRDGRRSVPVSCAEPHRQGLDGGGRWQGDEETERRDEEEGE